MARQEIYRGLVANDGQGDSLRQAAQKINANFVDLYVAQSGGDSVNLEPTNLVLSNGIIQAASNSGTNVNIDLSPKGTGRTGFLARPMMNNEILTTNTAASESIPLTICNKTGAHALTLAAGVHNGQMKEFVSIHASGAVTVTPANFTQGTSITLGTRGSANLRWASDSVPAAGKWYLISGYLATINP